MSRKRVVFLSGPYRGNTAWDVEQNIRRAEEVSLELWKTGFAVICVHTMCRFFQGVCSDDNFLEGDFELLKRSDCVLMLPGWENSEGSKQERNVALEFSIPVFYSFHEFKVYF